MSNAAGTRDLRWVIHERLGRGPRPGRRLGRDVAVPRAEVDRWIDEARGMGIRSIICLLADDQLGLYGDLGMGLVDYYRQSGFAVQHIPVRDHQTPVMPNEALAAVWEAYQELPKPVLVHCSAGQGRTGAAVEHILALLNT